MRLKAHIFTALTYCLLDLEQAEGPKPARFLHSQRPALPRPVALIFHAVPRLHTMH